MKNAPGFQIFNDHSHPISHCNCIICGSNNPASLRIHFVLQDDLSVRAQFRGNSLLQGYNGILHGGIIASVLDAAMTHCLFKNGIEAVTADLNVRYKHSIPFNAPIEVWAHITQNQKIIYRMESNIQMDKQLMAKATARFMIPS